MKKVRYLFGLMLIFLMFFNLCSGYSKADTENEISFSEAKQTAQKYLETVAKNSFSKWENANLYKLQ
ncbi:hypothetical protein [Anoxybacillus sp. J5B_2022]|uniref:hypothetical protein n=1 Tax=Anoxybacillus sp. J5B_2022 TaxID=3003246 RepID=UPI0022859864|nr:hypothetical protein [Anoxybacillus sp. J5B_2022]MCZ0756454.1 hypothetical protein [Anoxybacillus sp. J5B_2022]